jgi:hypothetical protein
MIELANSARRGSEARRVRWCAQLGRVSSLFIESRGCCGAVARSTSTRQFRRASKLGEGAVVFTTSQRSSGRLKLGRAVPKSVALLPCLPVAAAEFLPRLRRRRARVAVVGVSGGFVVARRCSTCLQGVQGMLELARRRVASGVRGVYCCDVIGILGGSRRVNSSDGRRPPRQWRC